MEPNPTRSTDAEEIGEWAMKVTDSLAALVKGAFLYPDSNPRVRLGTQEFIAALAGPTGARKVTVAVVDQGFAVDGAVVAVAGASLTRLREVMLAARVGGVEFEVGVQPEAVLSWVRRLQRNQNAGGTDFARLWMGDPLPGVVVREFVIETLADQLRPEPDPIVLTEDKVAELAANLAGNVRVSSELRALEKLLTREDTDNTQVMDLLTELVRNMSAEALRDPDFAAMVAERVLSAVRRTFMNEAAETRSSDGVTPMLVELGRKLFPRVETGAAQVATVPGRGHDDDHITDDVEALRAELQAFATQCGGTEIDATCEPSETAGIVLHALAGGERVATDALRDRLVRLATAPIPGVRSLLCDYFEAAFYDQDRGQPANRIMALLRSLELREVVRACGFFDAERVARDFPRRLALLAELCTPEQAAAVLAEVGGRLARDKILGADRWFAANPTVIAGERIERLLARGGRAVLPFAVLALRHSPTDCRIAVAAFLRQLNLGEAATALRVADPTSRPPAEYLAELCEHAMRGGAPSTALIGLSVRVIAQMVQELAGQPAKEARRLACVRALGAVDHPEARAFLREIVTARRHLVFRREPRVVRRAARAILRKWDQP